MTTEQEDRPTGKGRPTPKRREAEKRRRQQVTVPKNRKEAAKLQRETVRARRQEGRAALARGDLSKLPARDAGPVRAFVRDYVDTRRNVVSYFLPVAFLIFGFGLGPPSVRYIGNLLLLIAIVAVIIDSRIMGRRLMREIAQRFPKAETKGLKLYALSRAMQIRRLRLPKARVKRGDPI